MRSILIMQLRIQLKHIFLDCSKYFYFFCTRKFKLIHITDE